MMRLAVAFAVFIIAIGSAKAGGTCVVTDPTGTPINVRSEPNGRILGSLNNGAFVNQMDTVADEKGRVWTLIRPVNAGMHGWVFRQYINCF